MSPRFNRNASCLGMGYGVGVRRGPMSAWEIDFALQKRRLRAGWADIAGMLGRSEPDVRLACEEALAAVEAARG
ncbi:hypothetical protein [Brevundimonas sp.]|uniref:hypothetical protein n=1 Tax=Brevundimonas sp. TaxID=1871086 RepID=UPI002D46A2BE|nr:hypothetical protein [Brevundimonas sp.]HYD26919.1 hypothetical protein [Brevundimonas sp.]